MAVDMLHSSSAFKSPRIHKPPVLLLLILFIYFFVYLFICFFIYFLISFFLHLSSLLTAFEGATQNLVTQNTGFYSGDMYINMQGYAAHHTFLHIITKKVIKKESK